MSEVIYLADYQVRPTLEVRHDRLGFYHLTAEEAEHEDAGHNSVGFDGRPHYATIDAARELRPEP